VGYIVVESQGLLYGFGIWEYLDALADSKKNSYTKGASLWQKDIK
jgi:hypothetical protein